MRIDTLPEDMVGLTVTPLPAHAGQFVSLETPGGPLPAALLDEYLRAEAACPEDVPTTPEFRLWLARALERHPHLVPT